MCAREGHDKRSASDERGESIPVLPILLTSMRNLRKVRLVGDFFRFCSIFWMFRHADASTAALFTLIFLNAASSVSVPVPVPAPAPRPAPAPGDDAAVGDGAAESCEIGVDGEIRRRRATRSNEILLTTIMGATPDVAAAASAARARTNLFSELSQRTKGIGVITWSGFARAGLLTCFC